MGADKVGKVPAMKGRHFPPEVIEKERQAIKRKWQDPVYVTRQMKARGVHPNKAEVVLAITLQQFGFRYVGDGQLVIAGKCPDFWNGDHKVIELFGDYWHRGEEPEARIQHFQGAGYGCLVIWEHELEDEVTVSTKVCAFVES